MYAENPIIRRVSKQIRVGTVLIGGDAPIAVQSMTNTRTTDVDATVAQITRLVDAGVDIVRVSVPDMDAAEAFGRIKQRVSVPLVADIHFDYRIALRVAELGVDCLRINPGNIGREDRVRAVVDAARDRGQVIDVGERIQVVLLPEIHRRLHRVALGHPIRSTHLRSSPAQSPNPIDRVCNFAGVSGYRARSGWDGHWRIDQILGRF